jgi:hypothetical protein
MIAASALASWKEKGPHIALVFDRNTKLRIMSVCINTWKYFQVRRAALPHEVVLLFRDRVANQIVGCITTFPAFYSICCIKNMRFSSNLLKVIGWFVLYDRDFSSSFRGRS